MLKWANQRLEKLLGQDMSDVCEYLISIEDESELDAFVSGMLGEDATAFIVDLKQTRTAAAAMTDSGRVAAAADATASTTRQGQLSAGGGGKGAGGGGGGGYLTGSSADRRMSKSGAKNLRDLAGSKAREAEEAEARLTRNLQLAGGASAGGKVDLALAGAFAEEGMTAYVKAEELDAFGIASMKKDPKKKRCGQLQDTRSGENSPRAGVGCDVAPDTERVHKVKMSRAERAQLLQSDAAFLAPGRHVRTHGLAKRPDLNDQVGTIVATSTPPVGRGIKLGTEADSKSHTCRVIIPATRRINGWVLSLHQFVPGQSSHDKSGYQSHGFSSESLNKKGGATCCN